MQMIFQDPLGSLNGRMTIEQLVAEPMGVHGLGSRYRRRLTDLPLSGRAVQLIVM